jgi:Exopolysaccharide synthesis, ExoD
MGWIGRMDRVERSHDAKNPDTAPASQVLEAVRAETRGDKVAVGDVLDGAGARVYGLALMLFALPEALPLPGVFAMSELAFVSSRKARLQGMADWASTAPAA